MVSKLELKRVIEKTNKNDQWTRGAKLAFIANVESLMVFLAHRAQESKENRWGEGPQRILTSDVNSAFGEIWPNLYQGEENE
jgi:hypothetical protein